MSPSVVNAPDGSRLVTLYDSEGRIMQLIAPPGERAVTVFDVSGPSVEMDDEAPQDGFRDRPERETCASPKPIDVDGRRG